MLLKIHARCHAPDFERFKCDKCPKDFEKHESLRRHLRNKHQNEQRKKRETQLPSAETIRKLEKQKEEDNLIREYFKMECNLCKVPLATYKEAYVHFRKEHKRNAYLICCNRKVPSRTAALEHISLHKNPDAFR